MPGFCKSATREAIATHGFVLTPGRYVGAEDVEDDGEPFEEKVGRLAAKLEEQFMESAELEKNIRANLAGLASRSGRGTNGEHEKGRSGLAGGFRPR